MARVYVAGPMSHGDLMDHVRSAILHAQELVSHGHAPMVPQLSLMWQIVHPNPWDVWLYTVDLPWVEVADAVLRLPGESKGADVECQHARERDIPVFHTVQEVLDHFE